MILRQSIYFSSSSPIFQLFFSNISAISQQQFSNISAIFQKQFSYISTIFQLYSGREKNHRYPKDIQKSAINGITGATNVYCEWKLMESRTETTNLHFCSVYSERNLQKKQLACRERGTPKVHYSLLLSTESLCVLYNLSTPIVTATLIHHLGI